MGTRYLLKLTQSPAGFSPQDAQDRVDARLAAIDAAMSTWKPDSEVSRFNASRSTEWFPVSAETAFVTETALRIGRQTGGAFDITIGPLVNLWGFGPEKGRRERPPTDEELAERRTATGLDKLSVRTDPPALRKLHPALQIDLSAIAKGYAVDALASELDAFGVKHYMVEVGGEVRTRGERAAGGAWRIGIETPIEGERKVGRVVPLDDLSMATSGDYRNVYVSEGKRVSHTIDPRTGRPVTHELGSVSVVAADCMNADALATAFMVMGKGEAMEFATKNELAALFIVHGVDGFETELTPTFPGESASAAQSE